MDSIEQEILAEERRVEAARRLAATKWARWMGTFFWAGLLAGLFMLVSAARFPDALITACLFSAITNFVSSYATRRGALIAPKKDPVVYRSHTGLVRGANFSLGLAVLSCALLALTIRYTYF